jgi:HEAT repeat protein
MNATAITEQAIPALIEALDDPEVRVRANCAHALGRLDAIPAAAIPQLVECSLDADDGLRINAAMALKLAPAGVVADVMQRLVADPNSRVRLIAASSLLSADSSNSSADAVLAEALEDPAPRVRDAANELVDSLSASREPHVLGLRKAKEPPEELATIGSSVATGPAPGGSDTNEMRKDGLSGPSRTGQRLEPLRRSVSGVAG